MSSDQDRIRLAEAMGWQKAAMPPPNSHYQWIEPKTGQKKTKSFLPDPFTDANDDYAVLEWIRKPTTNATADHHRLLDFHTALRSKMASNYHLGDYARAALKVID